MSQPTLKQPRSKMWLFWLFLSVLVMLSALVPLATHYLPDYHRWSMLNRLTSNDMAERERGLNFLVTQLEKPDFDPLLLDGAIQRLADADDPNFMQLIQALDIAGQWDRPPIPDSAWLRWLEIIAQDADGRSRQLAVRMVAQLTDLADDPRPIAILQALAADKDADVRYQTLLAAAELSSATPNKQPYEAMIIQMIDDSAAHVARQAWLMLGLIDPISGVTTQWRDRPPEVAAAVLWAALRTNPDQPRPAIEALNDTSVDPAVRQAAAYALSQSKSADARDALVKIINDEADTPNTDNQALVWRAILGVQINRDDPEDPAAAALLRFRGRAMNDPLYLSAVHRLSAVAPLLKLQRPTILDEVPHDDPSLIDRPDIIKWSQQNMVALAKFEGMTQRDVPIPLSNAMQPATRLAAIAVSSLATPAELMPYFRNEVAPVRDLACVIAMRRFDEATTRQLIITLLRDFNDNAKISGAILAGLTGYEPIARVNANPATGGKGEQVNLLEYWNEHGSSWSVQQIMRLAMWMQNKAVAPGSFGPAKTQTPTAIEDPTSSAASPDDAISAPESAAADTPLLPGTMDEMVPMLLLRDDQPWTTILLAMLHRKHAGAYRFLFASRHELSTDPLDLIVDPQELFDQYRWWRVLQQFLPDDAPTFWVWGDPALENFQVEVLRTWYVLNRHALNKRFTPTGQ